MALHYCFSSKLVNIFVIERIPITILFNVVLDSKLLEEIEVIFRCHLEIRRNLDSYLTATPLSFICFLPKSTHLPHMEWIYFFQRIDQTSFSYWTPETHFFDV